MTLVIACGRKRITIDRERERVRLYVPDRLALLTADAARSFAEHVRTEARSIERLATRCTGTHPHRAARCNVLDSPARARCCTADVTRC